MDLLSQALFPFRVLFQFVYVLVGILRVVLFKIVNELILAFNINGCFPHPSFKFRKLTSGCLWSINLSGLLKYTYFKR